MVVFMLCMKAELENVASISLPKGHSYCITVKNSSGEDVREGVYVSSAEEHDLAGSKGTANFVIKWVRDARTQANLNVTEEMKKVTFKYTADDEGKYAPLVAFECRGLDPIDWRPEGGFIVESTRGKIFRDADFSDKEWMDVDEDTGESVSVMELEWKFETRR